MEDIGGMFTSLGGSLAAVTIISSYLNGWLKWEGWAARLVSWVVAALFVFVMAFFHFGYLANASVVETVSTGVALALASNGLFTIDQIKQILGAIGGRQPAVRRATDSV